ncbi:hypothetical protein KKB69_00020 [Patescibacteria group bacterium]|nr:hypothetical protein [Patescibacteria group bacterium]
MTEQALAKLAAEQHGAENIIVVVGFTSAFTLSEGRIGHIIVETFLNGDPAEAGPLAGVTLGIKTYSIFEFENEIPTEIWKECSMHRKKREIGAENLEKFIAVLKKLRGE